MKGKKRMKREKISIIVPIYNVEKYLERCVDSLVNQTYENIEIILVDDGSPDYCPQLCDEYAKKDSRIVVIHKKMVAFRMQEIMDYVKHLESIFFM